MTAVPAFRQTSYELGSGVSLGSVSTTDATTLGAALAAIDPWRRLGFAPERLVRFFTSQEDAGTRFVIRADGALAGFVCIDAKWLCGPYLHFIGVVPGHQHKGIGSRVVSWFSDAAQAAGERNAWVCVSDFNAGARALYERLGFAEVALLHDLVADGASEVLLRKALFVTSNTAGEPQK